MKLSHAAAIAALGVAGVLVGCGAAGSSDHSELTRCDASEITPCDADGALERIGPVMNQSLGESPSATAPSRASISSEKELATFVPHDKRVLASSKGDINNDGNLDVVVVLEATGNEQAAKNAPRTVLLLVRDSSGALRKASRNDKMVPCANCAGMFGDPFSSISIENGSITVVNEGGAGVYWVDEFTFTYELDDGWHLSTVVRSVTQRGSLETSRISLSKEDFGSISFDAFDPKKFPTANLTD